MDKSGDEASMKTGQAVGWVMLLIGLGILVGLLGSLVMLEVWR